MKDQIRAFLREGGDFDKTALDLYRWQRAHNAEYDRFCGEVTVQTWSDIPAVPTTLFRNLTLTSFPVDDAKHVFRTSGTTSGSRGAIYLMDTDIYAMSARLHAEHCLGVLPEKGLSLAPHAADSSLGHMCAQFVPGMQNFASATQGVQAAEAWTHLRRLADEGDALFFPGTAFAFADLLEHPTEPVAVPAGTIVMVTGGFKGRRRAVPAAFLHQQLADRMPGAQVVGEYGMSELASQLWAVPAGSPFLPPPWMRVIAVDPWTGETTTRGLLRFFDLANHQTVMAIETQDVGVVLPDGRVKLEGRLPGAVPRGCSLTIEEVNA